MQSPFSDIRTSPYADYESEDEEDDLCRRASIMEAAPIREWEDTKWTRLRATLFKERKVRQFYASGVLTREPFLRKVEYEELLLDLCIVFNIAFLSHDLKGAISYGNARSGIETFGLILGLVFLGWRNNAFRFNLLTCVGSDLMSKLEILFLILAFTGIGIGIPVIYDGSRRVLTALSGFTVLALPSIVIIVGGWSSPLRHPGKSPMMNHAVFRGMLQLICAVPYGLICVIPVEYAKTLYYVGFLSNMALDFVTDIGVRSYFGHVEGSRFYAFCIETWTERHELLALVSLGESALAIIYVVDGLMRSEGSRERAGEIFASICSLLILLFAYTAQYFEIDHRIASGHGASHAVRRSVVSSTLWSLLHYFMIFGLVFLAVGYSIFMKESFPTSQGSDHLTLGILRAAESKSSVRSGTLIVGAETLVSISLVFLSLCHQRSDNEVTKPLRLCGRVVAAIALFLIYWLVVGSNFSQTVQWVYTAVQCFMTITEFGIIRMDAAGWWLSDETETETDYCSDHNDSDFGADI